ncbi:hypothetical protein GCM10010191_87750 [Actinomadura vinacea]|uniref:Cytochrome P450 n=1 Tax=Actinomadura vinacea TaxID=115336 RepID=A0ABN3KCM4_9ACTN
MCSRTSPAGRTSAFAERWVGSVRRECTDPILLEPHVRGIVREALDDVPTGEPFDLVSALVEAESDALSAHELHMLCYPLLGAGNETTRNLITHALLGLTRNSAHRRRGRRVSPGARRPGNHAVRAANRDERVFGETAEEFDVTRDPNPHLAFGFGEHFCLGAALARVEARVLFDELVDRFGHWSIVGPDERLRSRMIRGIKRLPVVLAP